MLQLDDLATTLSTFHQRASPLRFQVVQNDSSAVVVDVLDIQDDGGLFSTKYADGATLFDNHD